MIRKRTNNTVSIQKVCVFYEKMNEKEILYVFFAKSLSFFSIML